MTEAGLSLDCRPHGLRKTFGRLLADAGATAHEIMLLLQMLNREHGKTIVMVTHDPKAAEYARRGLRLDKGTLAVANDLAAS